MIGSDPNKPKMTVLKQRLIIWDGDAPEDQYLYPDPSKHPKCVEIREKVGNGPIKTVYQRGIGIWL